MDEAPKDVATFNVGGKDSDVRRVVGDRYGEADATVRTLFVVVTYIGAQDTLCTATTDEQKLVRTLASCRVHPALGVRVGPRAPHRGADNLDAFRSEDLIEAGHEFGVGSRMRNLNT